MQTQQPSTETNTSDPIGQKKLQRNLENRHIQLIAIGGAIGTGLFLGSGKTISLAGPSIIFVYMTIGFFLFFVMRAMGELLLSNLNYRSFTDFASDLLGPWAGYFTGWTYWFCWIVTGVADVIAIAGYFTHWWPALPLWIPALGTIGLLTALNLLSVRMFGETEFWFAMIKIVTICSLIVIGIVLVAISYQPPETGVKASLSNIWASQGGLFPGGYMGFFAGFQLAIFSFLGVELVGTTAAEAKNPEKTLPRAINTIPIRIIIFYVLALGAIMAVTPWNQIDPEKSPFVTMFVLIGLPAAAGIINFVVITSAASSANSGVYSTSRMLYGLAQFGVAPKLFGRLSHSSVPANALLFSCLCLLLGSGLIFVMPNVMEAFTFVTSIATCLFMFVWFIVLTSYIVFRLKRAHLHQASAYKMPGGLPMTFACLAFFIFVIILLTFEADTRRALIITPLWFAGLGFFYWLIKYRIRRIIERNKSSNP